MNYYGEKRAYDFYQDRKEEDPYYYSTPRAGTFDCVDAVLPWRFEEPLPPPVPPKNDMKEEVPSIPERVTSTPWLLRRVKTPTTTHVTHTVTAPAPAPQEVSSTADIKRLPKPEPPAYQQHAVARQMHPSEERLAITTRTNTGRSRSRGGQVVQSQSSTIQVQPRTPPNPATTVAHRSARGRGAGAGGRAGGETQTQRRPPTPQQQHSGSGCPQLRSVRSAPHRDEGRSRPPAGISSSPSLVPLRSTTAVQPERVHLPSYHSSSQPFPVSPAPPPYRVSPSPEDSYPTSLRERSRSLPRSSRKHGMILSEKEATPLPPLPPLPSHSHSHSHQPQLSSSAISRIQAGFKISKQFGDAIMKQELRFATPTPDHSRPDLRPVVSSPRLASGQRFLSVSELQSHRKAKLRTDKITPEHEARLRTLNKSSPNVARCSGDSRQRAVSAHPGRGGRR